MDVSKLIDIAALVLAVYSGYLSAMARLDKRLRAIEKQVAVILDRDRRRRLEDYQLEEREED